MTDRGRTLRNRQEELQADVDRLDQPSPQITDRLLVEIIDGGSKPPVADYVFLSHPVAWDGDESEGGVSTGVVDTTITIAVVVVGGAAPMVGDRLVAFDLGGRWVAYYPCQSWFCGVELGRPAPQELFVTITVNGTLWGSFTLPKHVGPPWVSFSNCGTPDESCNFYACSTTMDWPATGVCPAMPGLPICISMVPYCTTGFDQQTIPVLEVSWELSNDPRCGSSAAVDPCNPACLVGVPTPNHNLWQPCPCIDTTTSLPPAPCRDPTLGYAGFSSGAMSCSTPATMAITFDFASDAQGFVPTAGPASTLAWTGSDGTPAGCLASTIAGSSKADSNYWELTTTFEDLGVPAGSTITKVTAGKLSCKLQPGSTGTVAGGEVSGPATLKADLGTVITLSQSNSSPSGSFAAVSGIDYTIASIASDAPITIRIANQLATGAGAANSVTLLQDKLTFNVRYYPDNRPLSLSKTVYVCPWGFALAAHPTDCNCGAPASFSGFAYAAYVFFGGVCNDSDPPPVLKIDITVSE